MERIKMIYYSVIENKVEDLKGLLENGSEDAGLIKPYGQGLLLHASIKGHYNMAGYLIEKGCKVNEKDTKGYTALHAASYYHFENIVDLLIRSGAWIDSEDNFGNTALMEAVFTFKSNLSVIRLLLENGADPFHKNNTGISPFSLAQESKKYEVVESINSLGSSRGHNQQDYNNEQADL